MTDELTQLRQRVKRQRAELRRLNSQLQSFWRGWHFQFRIERELAYRAKMIKAFGLDKVVDAERRS